MKLLPKPIRDLVNERGHMRNIERLIERDYPNAHLELQRTVDSGMRMREAIYLGLGNKKGKCQLCGEGTRFVDSNLGYKKHCSLLCGQRDPRTNEKRAGTWIKNFGVAHPMKDKSVEAKVRATTLSRYGNEHSLRVPEIMAKSIATSQKNWGADHWVKSENFTTRVPEMGAKANASRKATCQSRYGVDHILQVPEYFARQQDAAYMRRDLKIGRKTFSVQGYEGPTIEWLVKIKGVKPKDISNNVRDGLPSFPYRDEVGKSRVYYPDFKVKYKSNQFLVEVKSVWTLFQKRKQVDSLVRNWHKFREVHRAGHPLMLIVPIIRAKEFVVVKNPGALTKAGLRREVDRQIKAISSKP